MIGEREIEVGQRERSQTVITITNYNCNYKCSLYKKYNDLNKEQQFAQHKKN